MAQSKIRPEFLPTVWAGHEHASDIRGETQLLPAFAALLNGVFVHRLGSELFMNNIQDLCNCCYLSLEIHDLEMFLEKSCHL